MNKDSVLRRALRFEVIWKKRVTEDDKKGQMKEEIEKLGLWKENAINRAKWGNVVYEIA